MLQPNLPDRPTPPLPPVKVGYFIASKERHRRIFWDDLLKPLEHWGVTHKPIVIDDLVNNKRVYYPTWVDENYDILIISTDVANGSPDFIGDKGLEFFRTSQVIDSIRNWVSAGGILLCDSNRNGGRPRQEAYEAIFGARSVIALPNDNTHIIRINARNNGLGYENLSRLDRNANLRGSVAFVSHRFRSHPVCYGIYPFARSEYTLTSDIIPDVYTSPGGTRFSLYYRCPETLYSGWFGIRMDSLFCRIGGLNTGPLCWLKWIGTELG